MITEPLVFCTRNVGPCRSVGRCQGHTRCQHVESHTVDFGVGPIDMFDVECSNAAQYRVTFEHWDDLSERPVQEAFPLCFEHLDEDDVPGSMYHVRTEELFEEVA